MTQAMKGVARIDVGTVVKPKKLANGWLRVDAALTRTGVFEYLNPDGTKRREYRPENEVFRSDSLDTLHSLPVTDGHPPKLLDSSNTGEFSKGSLGEQPRRDGDMVASTMLLTDADLIKKVERGDARQVSLGYTCDLDFKSGVAPNGERYDAVQSNVKYNHAAVLPRGRAGSEVRVRMDAAELDVYLEPHTASPTPGEVKVKTIRIDGIDYEAGSDAAVQAIARQDERVKAEAKARADEIAELKKLHAESIAKMDEASKQIATLKKDAEEAPKKIRVELEARTALEATARKVLGSKVSFDGLDTRAVQTKVLAKLSPKAKLADRDDAYVAARFDAAMESFVGESVEPEGEREDASDVEREDEDDAGTRMDADEERKKMLKEIRGMASRPVGASLSEGHRGVRISN